jgi:hypothetical protein
LLFPPAELTVRRKPLVHETVTAGVFIMIADIDNLQHPPAGVMLIHFSILTLRYFSDDNPAHQTPPITETG